MRDKMHLKINIERQQKQKQNITIYEILNEYKKLNNNSSNNSYNNSYNNKNNIIKTSNNIN